MKRPTFLDYVGVVAAFVILIQLVLMCNGTDLIGVFYAVTR